MRLADARGVSGPYTPTVSGQPRFAETGPIREGRRNRSRLSGPGGRVDHLRAAFIAFHVTLITVAAMPTPSGYLDDHWMTDPQVVTSADQWASIPRALGVH